MYNKKSRLHNHRRPHNPHYSTLPLSYGMTAKQIIVGVLVCLALIIAGKTLIDLVGIICWAVR